MMTLLISSAHRWVFTVHCSAFQPYFPLPLTPLLSHFPPILFSSPPAYIDACTSSQEMSHCGACMYSRCVCVCVYVYQCGRLKMGLLRVGRADGVQFHRESHLSCVVKFLMSSQLVESGRVRNYF